jgi:cell wall-associated NlpC family hydrolase
MSEAIKKSSLIYVTLDLRRGLFVAEATGAIILCSYKSDLIEKLRERGITVWCFAEECPNEALPQTSSSLIRHRATKAWLTSLCHSDRSGGIFFLVFKPANRIREIIEKQGWKLISADPEICRRLEDKISFPELAKEFDITMPDTESLLWDPEQVSEYHQQFGPKFVVQSRMGHAGSNTWVIDQGRSLGPSEKGGIIPDTRVKLCRWINGPTYTVNGVISPAGKLLISPLWQQLMHVPQWNSYEMGTVGITPIANHDVPDPQGLLELIMKLGEVLHSENYRGFFGLDLMFDQRWYLIECNPRFTASVSLQCWIDVLAKRPALLAAHANQNEPKEDRFDFLEEPVNQYGHIILRNTKPRVWKLPRTLKSGIYSLDANGDWKLRLRDYHPDQLQKNEILMVLAHSPGQDVDPGSDFATLIYKGSALGDNQELHDRFMDFYDRLIMGYFIREQNFWPDRYVKLSEATSTYSKPNVKKDHLHTEAEAGEVIKLLGELRDLYLVERADGTRGWISSQVTYQSSKATEFELPKKASTDAGSFLKHWNGKPYRRGGNSESGIDCSAFVQRYFWETKGILLPKNSQDQKAACLEAVAESDVRDDDLIFLRHRKNLISHVGVARDQQIWHSSLEKGVLGESLEQVLEKYELEEFRRMKPL